MVNRRNHERLAEIGWWAVAFLVITILAIVVVGHNYAFPTT